MVREERCGDSAGVRGGDGEDEDEDKKEGEGEKMDGVSGLRGLSRLSRKVQRLQMTGGRHNRIGSRYYKFT